MKAATILFLLLLACVFTFPIAPAHAGTPAITSSSGGFIGAGGTTISTGITVSSGDIIVLTWQYSFNAASTLPGTTTASGGGATFSSPVAVDFDYCDGVNCGNTPHYMGTYIFTAQAVNTGMQTFTVSWVNGVTNAGLEAYDVSNVPLTAALTDTGTCAEFHGCGSPANTNNLNAITSGMQVQIAGGVGSFSGVVGSGYTVVASGTGTMQGMYSTTASSVTSPTNFPMTGSGVCPGNSCFWAVAGAVFGFSSTTTQYVVVPCTAFQLQCWWYPVLFAGAYTGVFLLVSGAAKVSSKALTYMMLCGLTYSFFAMLLMDMINVMAPLALSALTALYVVRIR